METRGVFLDISKAFDRVWHKGLLFKLKRIGIDGPLCLLLENYLKNRKQSRGGFRLSQVSHLTKVSEKKVGKKESYCFTGHSQLSVKS